LPFPFAFEFPFPFALLFALVLLFTLLLLFTLVLLLTLVLVFVFVFELFDAFELLFVPADTFDELPVLLVLDTLPPFDEAELLLLELLLVEAVELVGLLFINTFDDPVVVEAPVPFP